MVRLDHGDPPMTMHLLPVYFNDLKTRKKPRQAKSFGSLPRVDMAKLKHAQFIHKVTGGKKADRDVLRSDWLNEYKSTMQVDRSDYQSAGMSSSSAPKPEAKVYTGGNLKGIATMHKSNMVPVFNSQDAEDISKMRRG